MDLPRETQTWRNKMAKATKQVVVNWCKDRAGLDEYKRVGYKDYYTLVLQGKKKLKGSVKEMSPSEYLDKTDDIGYNLDDIIVQIKSGRKISIPVLDKYQGKKVGVPTVLACKELGVSKIPVLVCDVKKSKKED